MGEHMKYGGSTIELTELCPGSIKAKGASSSASAGAAADRGTRIHGYVEQLWAGEVFDGFLETIINPEELKCAAALVTALKELVAKHNFTYEQVKMEQMVTLHEIHPEAGGKADHVAYKVFGDLLVADTKTGYNYVSVEDSPQLAFYTEGVLESLDDFTRASIRNITFAILQSSTEPPYEVAVREWTISKEDFENKYAYPARFKRVIDRAEAEPDLRIPGEHCEAKYCNARVTCPAYINYLGERSLGSLARLMQGETTVKPDLGTRLSEQAKVVPLIEKWCKAIKEEVKTQLMKNPENVPDWELVDSYGDRTWNDVKEIDKVAKGFGIKPTELVNSEHISPAQFEKLLKSKKLKIEPDAPQDKQLEKYTSRPFSGLKIAQKKTTGLVQQFAQCEMDLKGEPCGRIKPCPIHEL